MEITDFIAIYAAGLSTCVAAWQVITYWHSRRPSLLVRCSGLLFAMDDSQEKRLAGLFSRSPGGVTGLHWQVHVRIINNGRARVQVSKMSVRQWLSGSEPVWDISAVAGLPRWIDVGEGWQVTPNEEIMPEARPGVPFDIDIESADGRMFKTRFSLTANDGKSSIVMTPERVEQIEEQLGKKSPKRFLHLVEDEAGSAD